MQELDLKVLLGVEARLCLCGCGEIVPAKDKWGRVVKYKIGHNKRKTIRDPVVVEVKKIKDVEEARSHFVTIAAIMNAKDNEIYRLQKLLEKNNIPYEDV